MKVLWITNILFPEAECGVSRNTEIKDSGGWLLGSANEIVKKEGIKLCVATVSPIVRELTKISGEHILYYIIPYGKGNLKYNKKYELYWKRIKDEFGPDIVHIHGTEFSHGLAYVNSCGSNNVVVSIQGLLSSCYKYYDYGLSAWQIIKNIAIKDLLRGTIFHFKRSFKQRSFLEKALLNKVPYIIGRTDWDHAHTWSINPGAKYYFCNETLREQFYDNDVIWNYDYCKKHSIFIAQAGYPLKGLHQLIKALPLVLKEYPDTQIYVAGKNILDNKGIKAITNYDGYGRIIKELIDKRELNAHFHFLGFLNALQMKEQYLKSNVFISLSSIENSPNSLGEAQILGVPCIASFVGGVSNMIPNESCGILYRFEDIESLAWNICKLFQYSSQFDNKEMIEISSKRHDRSENSSQLFWIYNEILKGNSHSNY